MRFGSSLSCGATIDSVDLHKLCLVIHFATRNIRYSIFVPDLWGQLCGKEMNSNPKAILRSILDTTLPVCDLKLRAVNIVNVLASVLCLHKHNWVNKCCKADSITPTIPNTNSKRSSVCVCVCVEKERNINRHNQTVEPEEQVEWCAFMRNHRWILN